MIHNKQIIKTPEIAYLITKTFKHNRTCYKLREVGWIQINQVDNKHSEKIYHKLKLPKVDNYY